MLLTSGPVNKDFIDGELTNWHLEIFNNSSQKAKTTLTVFALNPQTSQTFSSLTEIGTTFVTLFPNQYNFLNILINTQLYEHTLPVIEIETNEILLTLYGRNKELKQITGAVYRNTELKKIERVETNIKDLTLANFNLSS